jgi:uncharacterized protein YbjQ (UPF0145 family)
MAAEIPLALVVTGLCLGPFLLLALIGTLWSIAYPFVFLWGMATSGSKLDGMIDGTNNREKSTRESLGKDPLTTVDGGYRTDVSDAGLVYASGVFGPSHWHLLIARFNNLFGGSVTIFQKVISAGRAEVMQRLRENALAAGWDEVINVRIDTADMTPQGMPTGVKGVEVFAYGTGIRHS